MNQKYDLTKKIAEILNFSFDEKNIKKLIRVWWENPRNKQTGGLRLTPAGFEAFKKSQLKFYEIQLESPIHYTNGMVIWLDQKIECPYFINKNKITVFGEKTAVQLLLFSGDLNKLKRAHDRFQENLS
jgi:hypothetical protein